MYRSRSSALMIALALIVVPVSASINDEEPAPTQPVGVEMSNVEYTPDVASPVAPTFSYETSGATAYENHLVSMSNDMLLAYQSQFGDFLTEQLIAREQLRARDLWRNPDSDARSVLYRGRIMQTD
jgi:hypothetical protein